MGPRDAARAPRAGGPHRAIVIGELFRRWSSAGVQVIGRYRPGVAMRSLALCGHTLRAELRSVFSIARLPPDHAVPRDTRRARHCIEDLESRYRVDTPATE